MVTHRILWRSESAMPCVDWTTRLPQVVQAQPRTVSETRAGPVGAAARPLVFRPGSQTARR